MAQYISNDKKQEIIHQIRDEGKKATDVAVAYGVSTKTIYTWLRSGISGDLARVPAGFDTFDNVVTKVAMLR